MSPAVLTLSDVQELVRDGGGRCRPRGGGTKDGLSAPASGIESLDVATALRGVAEYLPGEFTLTVGAGTPVAEVERLLAEQGQYLPFDPHLIDAGATIGGTVASGLSGSGRLRFGGLRDFILGVRFVDGEGHLVRAGGKVVKNAAGFDVPKLMVGSLGSLGVLTEVTLKVFPRPEGALTVRLHCGDIGSAVAAMLRLAASPCEPEAVDIEAPGTLWVRISGRCAALETRRVRLLQVLGGDAAAIDEAAGREHWERMRELRWLPEDHALIKVPVTPKGIASLEAALEGRSPRRFYTAGGQQALVAWPAANAGDSLAQLHEILLTLNLQGLRIRGAGQPRRIGRIHDLEALRRVRQSLDPRCRFCDPL